MNYIDIDKRIKDLRTQHGISQTSLARQLGVSKSVVSSYETGVHLPPYDVLVKLSQIFSVSTDYLLGVNTGKTVNVDGLTNIQIEAVTRIVSELKSANQDRSALS